jgi:hypothetical protein
MPDAAHHRRVEARLNEIARRHFGPGVHHVTLAQVAALGHGNLEIGEQVLHRMGFEMVGPRSIAASGVRDVGNGSHAAGRKVLQRFFARADEKLAQRARGGAVDDDDAPAPSDTREKLAG